MKPIDHPSTRCECSAAEERRCCKMGSRPQLFCCCPHLLLGSQPDVLLTALCARPLPSATLFYRPGGHFIDHGHWQGQRPRSEARQLVPLSSGHTSRACHPLRCTEADAAHQVHAAGETRLRASQAMVRGPVRTRSDSKRTSNNVLPAGRGLDRRGGGLRQFFYPWQQLCAAKTNKYTKNSFFSFI